MHVRMVTKFHPSNRVHDQKTMSVWNESNLSSISDWALAVQLHLDNVCRAVRLYYCLSS